MYGIGLEKLSPQKDSSMGSMDVGKESIGLDNREDNGILSEHHY